LEKKTKLIIGTRSSELALWQSEHVKQRLEQQNKEIEIILKKVQTKGDKILDVALSKIGDKGLFTKELELELLNGEIDIAVHSLKDLETSMPDGLKLAAVTKRHDVEDVLIARNHEETIETLKQGAVVATGSLRRKSQLKNLRHDITVVDLRGNVPTRIKKFLDSDWDAIILARAGVERLGLSKYVSSVIGIDKILPAVGQGAIGIQIRKGNNVAEETVRSIHDENTSMAVKAERSLLKTLEGGCQVPIGAYGEVSQDSLFLSAMVGSLDGKIVFRKSRRGEKRDPEETGKALAKELLLEGADKILKEIYKDLRK
jgi:hydroxymethylbilane synthase